MKKIIFALSVFLTVTSAVIAAPVEKNPRAEQVFSTQFAGAENVQWSRTSEGILKVAFTWSGTRAEAYFDENAELLGTERSIFYNQVPLNVSRSVNARFKNAIVLAVSEISTNGGTRYQMTIEHGDKKCKAIISSLGEIMEVVKIKK